MNLYPPSPGLQEGKVKAMALGGGCHHLTHPGSEVGKGSERLRAESPSAAALVLLPFVISNSKCCLDQMVQPLSVLRGLEG